MLISQTLPITSEWLIGFTEGEGCWTWCGKWNNTTRNGKRVYYSRKQPQFLIAQKERDVLDQIAKWLLTHGISKVGVWPKTKQKNNFELRVLGYKNCAIICKIFHGQLRVPYKARQFSIWKNIVLDPRKRGPVLDSELLSTYESSS